MFCVAFKFAPYTQKGDFKVKFQVFLIATAITFLTLLSFAGKSPALEIEEVRPFYWGYDLYEYGGSNGVSHYAYAKTDKPYYVVQWYVNGVYVGYSPGANEGEENGPTEASCYFEVGTGTISGTTYTITAIATDQENHNDDLSDTDSYEVTVYKPITKTDPTPKMLDDVYGRAELSRHYRNGNDVIMDYYVTVYYHGDEEVEYRVTTENKNTVDTPNGLITVHGPDPSGEIGYDEDDPDLQRGFPDSGSITNSSLGTGNFGIEYRCEAYVRITVGATPKRDWHFINNLWLYRE